MSENISLKKAILIPLTILAVAAFAIFQPQYLTASPMAPMATMTIEGKITKLSWHPEKSVKGLRGISGSAAHDRTIPAHYKVTLEETVVTSDGNGMVPFTSGKEIILTLNHEKDDKFLKEEMKIKVIDFRMNGDEGGINTSFKEIEVVDAKK